MPSFNKVIIMGNLTRDVEIRHTNGNTAVGNFGVAINNKYKSKDGQQKEETTFVDCTAWGKTAETMAQYLSKGRPVFIEGRLKLDEWEKDGQKRSKLQVVVDKFEFIDSGGGAGGGGSQGGGSSKPAAIDHDDIPF